MTVRTISARNIDSDLLATSAFRDDTYKDAALQVVNRIRTELGLEPADRLLAGYRGDPKWGNPVVFTIAAGEPLMAAHFDAENREITVDTVNGETTFRLVRGSVIDHFVDRFEHGHYPELDATARKDIT